MQQTRKVITVLSCTDDLCWVGGIRVTADPQPSNYSKGATMPDEPTEAEEAEGTIHAEDDPEGKWHVKSDEPDDNP